MASKGEAVTKTAPQLLTEEEVAKRLHVSLTTLRAMRAGRGKDPLPFVKFGRCVRYSEAALDAWIQKHTISDAKDERLVNAS